ncbi:sensor histidine kinase [Nocardioides daeguensis]|uniref:histidine kinase n=1 Tax=Nocardioides daeguensis TaxID=908359 RepID=A0ABP6W9Z9_9ACTN|nr:HAMP domain-containing sensor histidine kinase [Nocardioides daeguensis]MBV6729832.1 HAMP domain-containing histidine kinase [Nocardioides daeguensis]MCR1774340.1 HAMP domain-containing histidine kinase [Nocardioides daeguensis]
MRRGGVRRRVTLAAVAVTALGAAIAGVLFVAVLHKNLEDALVGSAEQQADTIVAQLASGRSPEQATVTDKRDLIAQVIGTDGRVKASDHRAVSVPLRTRPGTAKGVRVRGLAGSYAVHAERAADGRLVVVALSEEQVDRATATTVLLLVVSIPLGVLLVAGVVWLAIGRALRPVEVMRREAAAISAERLHQLPGQRLAIPAGHDEIPRLAATFNDLLDRIGGAHGQQRQFVSDASHELRSPLAVLRQTVEVARRHPDSTTVARLADEVAVEETRMEGLVRALLVLARLDDQDPATLEVVDLDDLVLAEVDRLRASQRASGHTDDVRLDINRVSAGQTVGDPALLAQIVVNLLENAVRHATATVRITLDEKNDHVVLSVEDDGHGIAPADRERVFERFARLDEARARDVGGAGLGLAIVQKAVAALGGTVTVTRAELGGARFVVTLSAAR